jgi:hypothetical protein
MVSHYSRHAAILFFVGWYLIVPPTKGDNIQSTEPLGKWTYVNSFDTARECRQAALERQKESQTETPGEKERFSLSECIATSDPRLKTKAPVIRPAPDVTDDGDQ